MPKFNLDLSDFHSTLFSANYLSRYVATVNSDAIKKNICVKKKTVFFFAKKNLASKKKKTLKKCFFFLFDFFEILI